MNWFSKNLFFPLWDIKDGARRRHYLEELSGSQWWLQEDLFKKQWNLTNKVVAYAFQHCPYYRKHFSKVGFRGNLNDWESFYSLPLLTKKDVHNYGETLVSDEFDIKNLVEAKTGGSTGMALKVYFDHRCQAMRNAASIRSNRWAGWDIGMKVASIWGNPPVTTSFKKKLRNLLLHRTFYLDTMDINDKNISIFVQRWRQKRPQVLFGHAHSLYIVATYLQRMEIQDLVPQAIIATSMMLLEPERKIIERVFSCQVTNRYGCEEVGLIGCECEQHQGLHLNIDHLVVEFLRDDDSQALPGEEANIVVTDLVNYGMPLIRYKVGDLGVLSDRNCSCGRGLPLMERVVGRQADFLKHLDGSLVAGVSLVERTLTAIAGIEQMQLIQNDPYCICVNIVKNDLFNQDTIKQVQSELQTVFSPRMHIEIRIVSNLDQTRAGKYRFAICNI